MNINNLYSNNGASTSSNPFPSHLADNNNINFIPDITMRQQSPSHLQGTQPINQMAWNGQPIQMAAMNPTILQPQQQQWMPQPSQQFANTGMNPMAAFNMPAFALPPQLLHDALSLTAAVGPGDDPVLVQHILTGLQRGENYKVILNKMHGLNEHSASLWKDYYLENKQRIDNWVTACQNKKSGTPTADHPRTIKKPSPSSFGESKPGSHRPTPSSIPKKPHPQKKPSPEPLRTTPQALAEATGSRRATINSLTVGAPVFDRRLPPPHADIKIPDPPSRSPSPPTNLVPRGRGYRYTDEDDTFFIKSIQWLLKGNPDLSKQEICQLIAQKAPHHSVNSWISYWSMHHDLPDKILAHAREEADEKEAQVRAESIARKARKRPRYRDTTTSDEEEDAGDEFDDEDESSEEEATEKVPNERKRKFKSEEGPECDSYDEGEDGDERVRVYDESEMGQRGGPFTEADMYVTAKYICDFPNWASAMSKDRWTPFHERFPQRSAKSWGEYYRRYETEIDRLASRLQKEKDRRQRR